MTNKIRWGVLSTAKIGREKVIPAIQKSENNEVIAISSRNLERAKETAGILGIEKAYGSYEDLLNDDNIDAVYIPLPNHLHVEWAIKCIEAGKHVLCEKPIGLSAAEALKLMDVAKKYPKIKVMEAFMYRFHAQWQQVKSLVENQKIGKMKTIDSFFSYHNVDADNIRNKPEAGGGGMMDIGCYCVSLARFLFGEEPQSVMGTVEYDPVMQTDRIASGILKFSNGTSTFTCSTQLMPYQRVNILGTTGRIEIEVPFNQAPDKESRIFISTKDGMEEMVFDKMDQYTRQADLFAKAINEDLEVPTGLEDAVNNMKVIEAVFESDKEGVWKAV